MMMTCQTCGANVADNASVCWKCDVEFEEQTPADLRAARIARLESCVRDAQEKVDACSLTWPIVLFIVSIPLCIIAIGALTGMIAVVWGLINLISQGPAEAELRHAKDKLEAFVE
jgi:hypothetical protein